ncbi:hypothetical protein KY290_031731 [Solanum tuberosum]|uniref:Beta-ketoacyl synthase N-terminal domain-containing protein n=1 Tax=Solanum tuberosum TaxID=4113 RepID=A0ABQ7UB50_SOLTU|nr:hypothetical protein KY290_031731 [Solanum tuberosum]
MRGRKWFGFIPTRFHFRRFSSFDPPPVPPLRRFVVTGMVTPLGCGVETTWKRLIEGECGVRAICDADLKTNSFEPEVKMSTFDQLTSKVAAIVLYGSSSGEFDEQLWLNSKRKWSKAPPNYT